MKVENEVNGRWLDILSSLGVDHKYLRNKHGSCPFCGGRDRYRFDNKNGNGTFFCNQCGSGDGFNFLKRMFHWDFKKSAEEIKQVIGGCKRVEVEKKDPRKTLKAIASKLKEIDNESEVWEYLKHRNILDIPPMLKQAELYYYEDGQQLGPFNTMVSLITNARGQGISYHLTYLNQGKKLECQAPKKIMTPVMSMAGSYVELYPVEEHICIAEGIQTALSVHDLTELPTISALNAQNLAQLILPDVVKKVEIFSDRDESFTGQSAAYKLAERLHKRNIEVNVHVPPRKGYDWQDLISSVQEKIHQDWRKTATEEDIQLIDELVKTFNAKVIFGEKV